MADISSFRSFNHDGMGMEDLLFCQQWSIDSIDELSSVSMASIFCEDFSPSYDYLYNMNSRQPDLKRAPAEYSPEEVGDDIVIRPLKQLKPENKSNSILPPSYHTTPSISRVETIMNQKPKEETWYSSTTTSTINFGQQNYNVPKSYEDVAKSTVIDTKSTTTTTRVPSAQERMLAERKRREQLTKRFIALSALVPGLKKMDKASVLGDAIKYLKHLEDKVKILEEQQTKRRNVVSVKKYKLDHIADHSIKDYSSSSDGSISISGSITTDQSLIIPEIETRLYNKDVLIHIHCEREKGVLEKTVAEIEKLNLFIVNSSVITFGDSFLNISLVAEMDEGFTLEMNKELVKNLNEALSK